MLRHPNIIAPHCAFQSSSHVYLVMEIVSAGDLVQCILHDGVFTNFFDEIFQDLHFAFHADSGLSYTGDQATQSYLES